MQAESARPVKTFTIGFREGGYDETHHAAAVARHLGTEHTELYLEARDALDVIPLLPVLYDEPFADSSQIPTFLVSRLARRHVTVSLSGDGGDELFCGYRHYKVANDISRFLRWIPPGVGKSAGRALEAILGGARGLLAPRRPAWLDRLESGAKVLQLPTTDALARWMVSQRIDPTAFVLGSAEPRPPPDDEPEFPHLAELLMYRDGLAYLPDGVLVKVDRASMGVSLEARAPLLDHRVVEMAWRLPFDFKLRDGEGKWVLRQVLYRHVPRELVERPKMGFSVPVGSWLRGPLTEWAHDLLSEDRLNREGYLAPSLVSQVLREHLSGKDWSQLLWNFLMFETWLDDAARPPSGTGAAPGTEVTHGAGLPVRRTDS